MIHDLKAEKRTEKGKEVRKKNLIPGIVYGKEIDSVPVQMESVVFNRTLSDTRWKSTIFNLKLGKKKHEVLIREIQYDTFKKNILHVDLYAIKRGEKINIKVPVILHGESVGVQQGGVLEHLAKEIEVRCLPKEIPEKFEVEVTDLDVGDYVKIGDIEVSDSIEIINSLDENVVVVSTPMKEIVIEEEEEEVVGVGLEGEELPELGEEGEELEGEEEEEETEEE